MGIRDRLKSLEARADAWAGRRLSPEEFQDAVKLDQTLKTYWARALAAYLAVSGLITMLLIGIKPTLAVGETFVLANLLVAGMGIGLMGAWFGHRRHANKPYWKLGVFVVAITAAGAMVGAFIGRASRGKGVLDIGTEEFVRMLSIGVLTGLLVAVVIVAATWLRNREAKAREAALAATAERERLEKRNREAELKLLQAQVEPHFLFNTLANLRHLVQKGSPDALRMLDHLIDYLRNAVPEIRGEGSTLGREAALARAYLEIIRLRMGGELAFAIDVPESLASRPVPALMLMTLVENAVKHGIAPIGQGAITLRAEADGDALRVTVEDDGRGLPDESPAPASGGGVGLANIRERLEALHGADARLDLAPREGGGCVATLRLPAPPALAAPDSETPRPC